MVAPLLRNTFALWFRGWLL